MGREITIEGYCPKWLLSTCKFYARAVVAGEGFEPSKAEPGDLQSPPIGRSGNPPRLITAGVDYLI